MNSKLSQISGENYQSPPRPPPIRRELPRTPTGIFLPHGPPTMNTLMDEENNQNRSGSTAAAAASPFQVPRTRGRPLATSTPQITFSSQGMSGPSSSSFQSEAERMTPMRMDFTGNVNFTFHLHQPGNYTFAIPNYPPF